MTDPLATGRTYRIGSGNIVVTATSSLHDTTIRFGAVSGTVFFDPTAPTGATAQIKVDMRTFDAGDPMKNWKLKNDVRADEFPTATFTLERLDGVKTNDDGTLTAAARGVIGWRGKQTTVTVAGSAAVDKSGMRAQGTFLLDVTLLGMATPKVLMFRVDPVVRVAVDFIAS